jgi:2-polyprenyl-6-methoxyphenol hydroxylase-like FAD-dependent oxidoreductase
MDFDVVIAGAGPNGLMLAGELALGGVRAVVLEPRTGPSGEQRANGLVGQVVRMMDRRGLFERLAGTDGPPQPAPRFMFGAFPLDLAQLADNPVYTLLVPQRRTEEVLAERATELGVEVRRGHALAGLTETPEEDEDDGIVVEVDGPAGRYRISASYLVGADGGHSLTRKLAGIDFPGVTTDHTVSRTAHVSVASEFIDPATGGLRVPGCGVVPPFLHHRTERGLVAWAPFPNGTRMVTASVREDADDSVPLTIDEVRDAFRRVVGADVPFGAPEGDGPHLLRRLVGGNTRIAQRYRAGRVLLVGDAAHVHSAIGGQGLNLGLQDSINLGWKLAATVRGWAPPGLLDTYESERRPAGLRVTMNTEAQSVLIGPGPEVTALRTLFGELLEDRGNVQRIADLISGADLRYDGMQAWAPDLVLKTGAGTVRLAELTRDGRPLLLDLTPDGALAATATPWRDRVDVVTARCDDPAVTAMLVRPDCYVAWSSSDPAPDGKGLEKALTRWFGEPAPQLI